ncbi:MAG: Uma2 family endonuclease [Betaproteobacteria bacterium]
MAMLDEPLVVRHRLTVDDYYKMAETGVLTPQAKLELINGEVVDMPPMGTRPGSRVARLERLLHEAIGRRAMVRTQLPLRLNKFDEPEPDFAVVKPREDFYEEAHPCGADTLLVIEVAETSARYDREIKVPLYARHGVPEVWIVDLEAGLVRFYRQPNGEKYTDITATETPGPTPVVALPGIAIDLTDVL